MTTRREWLSTAGLGAITWLATPAWARTATPAQGKPRTLVVLFQRGGMDALSAVVPHGDPGYYAARASIAIARSEAIDLDGFFGLHPRLGALAKLFESERLAIVHATGSPDGTRSHFDAQDYMECGTPGRKNADGWLNRALSAGKAPGEAAFRGVAVSKGLPRILHGAAPAIALDDFGSFGVRGGARLEDAFEAAYAEGADRMLGGTGEAAFEAVDTLRAANPGAIRVENGARYPRSKLGQSLEVVARLVKSGLGTEIAFVECGGWDTHVNAGGADGQLAQRLGDLGESIGAFATDLGKRLDDVLLLTMSEFGRAVAQNGNRGTDHGHGTAFFALGGSVKGGRVLGRWPGLAKAERFEERDLAVTTDFRAVLAEVASSHLGIANATALFPGWEPGGAPGLFEG